MLATWLLAAPASAAPITFAFSGTVQQSFGEYWDQGDPLAGWYRFESLTPGTRAADDIGINYDAIVEFLVRGRTNVSGSSGRIHVHLNEPTLGGESAYLASMHDTSGWSVLLDLYEQSCGCLVSNESIQTAAPRLSPPVTRLGSLSAPDGDAYLFSIDRLVRVPEPATALMFGAGLAGLVGLRGRRARNRVSS